MIKASLCITTYNQVLFVVDALRSALAQDYSNLEIVICDDHSTDGTWDMIWQVVADYIGKGGSHVIKCIQNTHNLGCGPNDDKCFRLASGDLRITGSGDDISYPNRVSRLVEIWEGFEFKPMALIHDGWRIDENGCRIGYIGTHNFTFPLGAVTAYNAKLFNFRFTFPKVCYEDHIYAPVAEMLGGMVYVPDKLIDYRVGTGQSTHGAFRIPRIKSERAIVAATEQSLRDLELLKNELKVNTYDWWKSYLENGNRVGKISLAFYEGKTLSDRLAGYRLLKHPRMLSVIRFQQLCLLLPPRIGDVILSLYYVLKRVLNKFIRF